MVHEKRKSSLCVGSQISFAKMRGKCKKGIVKVYTCERRSIFIKQMFRIRFDSSLYVDTFLIFEEIDYTFDGFEDIRFYVKQFVRLTE